jgi:hypothetical protein
MSKPELTLVAGGKSNAPVDVIDELFEPRLKSMSFKECIDSANTRVNYIRVMTAVACGIIKSDRAELLAKVAENPDWASETHRALWLAKKNAEQLAGVIDNAKMRLAVALDIPITDDDDDDEDDDGGAAA